MWYPGFRYGCGLEFNAAQTQAYLHPDVDNCTLCGNDGPTWLNANITCACPILDWDLDCCDQDQLPTRKLANCYTTPELDNASWYDVDIPESGQFMGFLIESIEGMDSTGSRNVQSRSTGSGGGVLGAYRRKERVLKVTVFLFACNDCSMEYGFRYLVNSLSPGACDDCELCNAEIMTCCTTAEDPNQPTREEMETGRWQLKGVGLVDGPKWIDPPIDGLACYVRRAEFTLVSESPWLYKCPVCCFKDEPISDAQECDPLDTFLCTRAKKCCPIVEDRKIGETAVFMEITARENLTNITFSITPDPFGYVCESNSRPADWTQPDPCQTFNIPLLPEGYTFTFDGPNESITVTKPGGSTEDGTRYIETEPGSSLSFPSVSCGTYCACIEVDQCFPPMESTITICSTHREM